MATPQADTYALVAVVRPSGDAMFHTQDCDHAKRASRVLWCLPDDFAPGDKTCTRCLPGGLNPTTSTGDAHA